MSQRKNHESSEVCLGYIWISYFITNQHQQLIEIIDQYELDVFSCTELEEELVRVLNYHHLKKYKVNIPLALKILRSITTNYIISYPVPNYIPDDKNDNYVIALALQTNSGFVTSGDIHILSYKKALQKRFRKLRIITKKEFEQMFPL